MNMKRTKHPLYNTWKNMIARCYNEANGNYKFYGAKGITVDEHWRNFDNFVYDIDNHMPNGHLLYNREYQLDKDLKGGKIYSLETCSVILAKVNRELVVKKQRKKVIATNDTETLIFNSIEETSNELNIPRQTLYHYLRSGKNTSHGYIFKYSA
ncbi:TPA: hypothetical protein QCO08_005536 [Bacillus anthracis]|nr:hypothetical protein [Bacillus anthracis]